jgi:hypothetical protein
MATLPSGLPDLVNDEEDLARFLTQSNQFNALMAKPAAFLPNPKYRNTSVFRYGNDPERLRQTWQKITNGQRSLRAAAVCKTRDVRAAGLDVIAAEPPDAHANIEGWPWLENDPDLQKARQIEMAGTIAQAAEVVLL